MSEIDIGGPDEVQLNWQLNAPINNELRRVMEPLASHLRDGIQMQTDIYTGDNLGLERAVEKSGNPYHLAYGRIGKLPPALFGEISEDQVVRTRELVVPEDEEAITDMVMAYERWARFQARCGRYCMYAFPEGEILAETMNELKGMEYPVEDWQGSAEAMQQALRDEPNFTMDAHRAHRIKNPSLDYDQLSSRDQSIYSQHDRYTLVMSKVVAKDQMALGSRDYVQLPIGEYGADAADRLARITVRLNDFTKTSWAVDRDVRNTMHTETEDLVIAHTTRARQMKADGLPEPAIEGTKATLAEGILSISQVISFLTAEKVDGYDNFDTLVGDILDSDVIEQFTRMVRVGFIGPMTLAGLYVPGVLDVSTGKPRLSRGAVEVLGELRREYMQGLAAKWAVHRAGVAGAEQPGMLGLVCPAAAPQGAITKSKDMFRAFYR
jgi:hypothetical protein